MKRIKLKSIPNATTLSKEEMKSIIGGKVVCSMTCPDGSDARADNCDACVYNSGSFVCVQGATSFTVSCSTESGSGESGSGEYDDPYTGSHLIFYQKSDFSNSIQIDHIVALSDAWQKGAQKLTSDERYNLATDPLNLIAVSSKSNQDKSDGDSATWLPPNKQFRCTYIARQISVKYKYHLWVTEAEKSAMLRILSGCPSEPAAGVSL